MERLLEFLQSKKAMLIAAIMSLTTQLWHSVDAFVTLDIGGADYWPNYIFGIFFSGSTSFAILVFTVRGRVKLAYFFLAVEVFINVIHYRVMNIEDPYLLFSTFFMCLIVPITISVYSSEINRKEKPGPVKVIDSESFENDNLVASLGPPIKLNKRNFVNEINRMIGFDITKQNDKSGTVSDQKKKELRDLWKNRAQLTEEEIKTKISGILDNGKGLFNNLDKT